MTFSNKAIDRAVDELIGICKGILFDGSVSEMQVHRLWQWFDANEVVKRTFIGRELFLLLEKMVDKERLSVDDQTVLLDFFSKVGGSVQVLEAGHNPSSELPLNDPAPSVVVNGSLFVLTGNFRMGNRASVVKFIESLGGRVSPKTVYVDTDYLIIGDIGSEAWAHSTHGRKIEHAVSLRDSGHKIAIISEAHFMNSVG